MKLVEKERLFSGIPEKADMLMEKLNFLDKSPYITDLRGSGLAIAFDIVDPLTKRPADSLAKTFVALCLEEHVIVYACGVNFNSVKIIPSLVVTYEEIDIIVESLSRCLQRFHDHVM